MSPPCFAKPSSSLTVRTGVAFTAERIAGTWLFSDRLTKRSWQLLRSSMLRERCTESGRLWIVSCATVSSSTAPNGSSPSTPIVIGAVVLANACDGHSTNCRKLNRKAALMRYSAAAATCPFAAGPAGRSASRSATANPTVRIPNDRPRAAVPECWIKVSFSGSTRRKRDARGDAAGDLVRQSGRAELHVIAIAKILADQRELPAIEMPRQLRVEREVGGNSRRQQR